MKFLMICLVSLMSTVAFADEVKLYRKSDGKIEEITLNKLGAPQSSDKSKPAPTILEFNSDKYLQACYVGTVDDGLKLVQALIVAADEGAEASTKTEKIWSNKQGRIRATITIDNGQVTQTSDFKFTPCE